MARKKKSNAALYATLAGGSAAVAGVYYVINRMKNDDAPVDSPAIASKAGSTSSSSSSSSGNSSHEPIAPELAFPLKIGDRNEFVRNLQAALISKGGEAGRILSERGGADGIFGDATKDALYESGYVNRWYVIAISGKVEVDRALYEKIVNQATLRGVPMPVAYAAKDTFMLTPELIAKGKAYPVRGGVRLGKFKGATEGMAEIIHPNGKSYFTKETDILLQ